MIRLESTYKVEMVFTCTEIKDVEDGAAKKEKKRKAAEGIRGCMAGTFRGLV